MYHMSPGLQHQFSGLGEIMANVKVYIVHLWRDTKALSVFVCTVSQQ